MAGDLVAKLGVDDTAWTGGFARARATASSFSSSVVSSLAPIGGAITAAAAAVAGAFAVGGFGVKLAAEAEQSKIAFEVMLGSAEKAQVMLAALTDYANHSPFDLAGTQEAAKKLLNYGIAAGDVLPTIKLLGDVAAGDMNKFDGLSTAFGQMSATGRLMGQHLEQFINAGFNPLQEIAAKTGESMATLKKRMEDGGVSADEVRYAFQAATSEGGRFFGMTERQSGTIIGKFNTMKDGVAQALRTIGEDLIKRFSLSQVLDNMIGALEKVPGFFVETMDAVWPIVQAGIEGLTPIFTYMSDTIKPIIAGIPFFFRNAGSLIEAAVLDWQIALYELIPRSADVMGQVGSIMIATWDGIGASFNVLIENIKSAFVEIANVAQAVWKGITTGFNKGSIAEGFSAGVKELASQNNPANTDNALTAFFQAFTKTMNEAKEGIKDSGGFKKTLQDRKNALLNGIGESEAARAAAPLLKAPDLSLLGGSKKVGVEVGQTDKDARSKAALLGSAEAASVLTRGIGGKDDTAKQQLSVAEKSLTVQQQTKQALEKSKPTEIAKVGG